MSAPARLAALALSSLPDRAAEASLLVRDWLRRSSMVEVRDRSVASAMARAVSFLRRRQRQDGQFRGFLLLPGASTAWLTAHVALVLEEVTEAQDICRAAAGYVSRVLEADGGCGYNRRVGYDCDSTAQALLAVHRFDLSYPRSAFDWLLAAQRPEGGFPTYPSPAGEVAPDGWHAASADVTAVVLMALRRLGGPADRIERAEAWLASQTRDGLVAAYWWADPGYGLWAQSRAGFEAAQAARAADRLLSVTRTQPSLAMLVVAASQAPSASLDPALAVMLDGQDRDGSWRCAPCLRVTDRRCDQPGAANPGPVYADRRRIFSTAYAVAALALIEQSAGASQAE